MKTNQKTKGAKSKILEKIRNLDSYGHPISLSYKDSSTYKSVFGGIFTLIARIGLLAYFLVDISQVFQKQRYQITLSTTFRDLVTSEKQILLNRNNFDVAVAVYKTDSPVYSTDFYEYFTVSFVQIHNYQVDGLYYSESTLVQGGLCQDDRFLGDTQTLYNKQASQNFICPERDFEFKIKGIDNKDFVKPIKPITRYMTIFTQSYKSISKILKLSTTTVEFHDSMLSNNFNVQTKEFYQLDPMDALFVETNTTESSGIRYYIIPYDGETEVVRSVDTILTSITNAGGFMSILFVAIQLLIGGIQERMFYQSLISKMYLYHDNNDQSSQSELADKTKRSKEIYNYLKSLKKPYFSIWQKHMIKLKSFIYKLMCKQSHFLTQQQKIIKQQQLLLDQGMKKTKQFFEITNVLKKTQQNDLALKVMFSKHQFRLIPYLDSNILNHEEPHQNKSQSINTLLQKLKQSDPIHLKISLAQLLQKCDSNKLDKRLLKQLMPNSLKTQMNNQINIVDNNTERSSNEISNDFSSQSIQVIKEKHDNVPDSQRFEKNTVGNITYNSQSFQTEFPLDMTMQNDQTDQQRDKSKW
eukprot:403361841